MVITFIAVCFPMLVTSGLFGMDQNMYDVPLPPVCNDPCRISLVESIPVNLTYAPGSVSHVSTFSTWMDLIGSANSSIRIASLYWTLRTAEYFDDPTDWQGHAVYNALLSAGKDRGIKIQIAQSQPTSAFPSYDTIDLAKAGAAEVRSLNFTHIMGAGVLHTKFWIIDDTHVYLGSANMDWRSLTQVKEMGMVAYNCSCIARDMQKIFDVYWYLGHVNATVPKYWPKEYNTKYNTHHPFNLTINSTRANLYFSSSPAPFCPRGRTVDLDALLGVIHNANQFIHIAVMDYFPATIYSPTTKYWPVIDDALRRASIERGVRIKILCSLWNHTRPDMIYYLRSLEQLSGAQRADIQIKLFQVPTFPPQQHIPFARVNHNKYMVTESTAYIGTSNWSGDYFINTGGAAVIINGTESNGAADDGDIPTQLEDVFQRDWNSSHAMPLTPTVRHSKHKSSRKKIKLVEADQNKNHEMNEL